MVGDGQYIEPLPNSLLHASSWPYSAVGEDSVNVEIALQSDITLTLGMTILFGVVAIADTDISINKNR